MKRKIAAIALLGLVIAGLAGCGSAATAGYQDEGFSVEILQGPNDNTITCVLYDGYDGDTIDCDFGGVE